MQPTTPTGSRTTSELPTCSSYWNSVASLAWMPKFIAGRPAWIALLIGSGMPTSCAMIFASSSLRAISPAEIFCRYSARFSAGVADHAGNAALAAFTARSMSCAEPSGTRAITSSVPALITSMAPLPAGEIQSPLMNSLS
jgi:hypothetical protein